MKFNEDSRVKIPSILHLCRLGYEYLSLKNAVWDEEVWNQGDETAIDRYFSKDGIAWGIGGTPLSHGQYKEHFQSFRKEMPNIRIDILDVVSEGEKIALRCLATIDKEEAAPRCFEGMTFCIIRDGWLMEAWNVWDFQEMMKQIGKAPSASLKDGQIA